MRHRLLRAWVHLMVLWWGGYALVWALSPAAINESLIALGQRPTDALSAPAGVATVLQVWTAPAVARIAGAFALGATAALLIALLRAQWGHWQMARRRPRAPWRGIRTSLGDLPRPGWVDEGAPLLPLEALPGPLRARLTQTEAPYRTLLLQALGALRAHDPGPVAGHGRYGLYAHALHVLQRVAATSDDPLAWIAAACHDAGKRWTAQGAIPPWGQALRYHDRLSARFLAGLPAFAQLAPEEQRLLLAVVKYAHARERTPLPETPEIGARREAIVAALQRADGEATQAEAREAVPPEVARSRLLEALRQALAEGPWQTPGAKPGLQALGWRRGQRYYVLERRLHEALCRLLDQDTLIVLGGNRRPQGGRLAPLSRSLIDLLTERKVLVTEHDGLTADPPLWRIRSGTNEFVGVLILQRPDVSWPEVPESPYALEVLGPLFVAAKVVVATPVDDEPDGGDRPQRQGRPKGQGGQGRHDGARPAKPGGKGRPAAKTSGRPPRGQGGVAVIVDTRRAKRRRRRRRSKAAAADKAASPSQRRAGSG